MIAHFETIQEYHDLVGSGIKNINPNYIVFNLKDVDYDNLIGQSPTFRHDFFEIILIKQSEIFIHNNHFCHRTNDSGYHILVSSPSDIRSWRINDKLKGKCLIFNSVAMGKNMVNSDFFKEYNFFQTNQPSAYQIEKKNFRILNSMLKLIKQIQTKNSINSKKEVAHLINAFLIELKEAILSSSYINPTCTSCTLSTPKHETISKFFSILSVLEPTQMNVSKIADQIGISAQSLSKITKSVTKKTPTHNIANEKVKKAKKLLISTTIDIKEVAYNLGFYDISHFHKTFKNFTGKTPKEFRKINTTNTQTLTMPPEMVYCKFGR